MGTIKAFLLFRDTQDWRGGPEGPATEAGGHLVTASLDREK